MVERVTKQSCDRGPDPPLRQLPNSNSARAPKFKMADLVSGFTPQVIEKSCTEEQSEKTFYRTDFL